MHTEYSQVLFDAIGESAVLLDKTGRIIDWNQGATSLFGYPKKEVLGRSINLIYQQNIPFPKLIQETLLHQKRWQEETAFIRKNGVKGLCKTIVTLINHSDAHKVAALVIHFNLSSYKAHQNTLQENSSQLASQLKDRLEMLYLCNSLLAKNMAARDELEKVLRESELRFHLLAENATDMISRHSPDGTYLYVSPSSKTILGFSPEELIGRNAYRYVHYDDVNKMKKVFNRRKNHENKHQTITYRIKRKEGDYRWFESNVRIIFDEEDNRTIREIQTASRDITDRVLDKKARLRGQQLAHVFRLSSMEEMASGMAHEISQPLAAIVNYTQGCVRYLQKESHDPAQLMEIMNKAVSQAERAGEVIHRLKNFFCKGQLIRTPCKINSIIRETVSLIRHELNASKTKIDFELSKDIPIIYADKIQFQQVIINLIKNAMEAMEEIHPVERKIHLKTKYADKNHIELTVSDSGPGFSKEMINKVFKPFFTTKAHGRGMGLAISRSIIEAHGGQFTINPNTHHKSWISFTLPINYV
jgi:PAS domain S-box-containing protein